MASKETWCGIEVNRISNLPEEERATFDAWLLGQTRPIVEGVAVQDYFYEHDYLRWKAGLPVID